jgi:GTP-binding protein
MQPLDARFIISAVQPEQFPREDLPEFAFLGRSNVGKSSLLNALAAKEGLAKTSATPGRTQAINFFRIGEKYQFVDLPGYGYARVPREITSSWKALIDAYLTERRTLALCFILLDARRGWMDKDLELRVWLESHNRRFMVVATKFDKLKSQKDKHSGLAQLRKHCSEDELVPFSAITGQGVKELWQTITKTTISPTA